MYSLLDFTGQATEQLKPFQVVIGIDPSSVMLDKARASLSQSLRASTAETKFQFIQGSAEELNQTTLQPESVDLITAGMTFEIEKSFSKLTEIDYYHFIIKRSLLIGSIGAKSGHKHIVYCDTEALLPSGYLLLLCLYMIQPLNNPRSRFMQNFNSQIIPLCHL